MLSLYCGLNESQIIKGTDEIAQHHVYHEVAASYVPVYEDIQSSLKDSNIPIPEPCDCEGDRSSQKNGGKTTQDWNHTHGEKSFFLLSLYFVLNEA